MFSYAAPVHILSELPRERLLPQRYEQSILCATDKRETGGKRQSPVKAWLISLNLIIAHELFSQTKSNGLVLGKEHKPLP